MTMLTLIGRAERVQLPDHGDQLIPAKIDTGADMSSIWATGVHEKDGQLSFVLFGKKSEFYTGKKVVLAASNYKLTRIANSFGDKELRYVVQLRIIVNGRTIKAAFSLANRARKMYPILLGRRLLHGKFVVDVSQGEPLIAAEKARLKKLQQELRKSTENEEYAQ
jgi:hypothetical protein